MLILSFCEKLVSFGTFRKRKVPLFASSNDGENENPKSEEFSELGDVKFTNTLWL